MRPASYQHPRHREILQSAAFREATAEMIAALAVTPSPVYAYLYTAASQQDGAPSNPRKRLLATDSIRDPPFHHGDPGLIFQFFRPRSPLYKGPLVAGYDMVDADAQKLMAARVPHGFTKGRLRFLVEQTNEAHKAGYPVPLFIMGRVARLSPDVDLTYSSQRGSPYRRVDPMARLDLAVVSLQEPILDRYAGSRLWPFLEQEMRAQVPNMFVERVMDKAEERPYRFSPRTPEGEYLKALTRRFPTLSWLLGDRFITPKSGKNALRNTAAFLQRTGAMDVSFVRSRLSDLFPTDGDTPFSYHR